MGGEAEREDGEKILEVALLRNFWGILGLRKVGLYFF